MPCKVLKLKRNFYDTKHNSNDTLKFNVYQFFLESETESEKLFNFTL